MILTVKHLKGSKFEILCRSHRIITDQPESEGGTDKGMTPVELLIASIASCTAYFAAIFLERRIQDLTGLEIRSDWEYVEEPHRVGAVELTVVVPHTLTESEERSLRRTLEHCTIKNTLEFVPDVRINVILTNAVSLSS